MLRRTVMQKHNIYIYIYIYIYNLIYVLYSSMQCKKENIIFNDCFYLIIIS